MTSENELIKSSDDEFFKSIGIDLNDNENEKQKLNENSNESTNISKTIALASVTAGSIVAGFFGTLALAKKRDGASLDKALLPRRGMSESGTKLAFRALGWGTLYAVGGFAVVSYAIYQLTILRSNQFKEREKSGDRKFKFFPEKWFS